MFSSVTQTHIKSTIRVGDIEENQYGEDYHKSGKEGCLCAH